MERMNKTVDHLSQREKLKERLSQRVMQSEQELRSEWAHLCAVSCDFGLSPACTKCGISSATCECAYQSWVVNTKQRAINEEKKCGKCGVAHSTDIRCELIVKRARQAEENVSGDLATELRNRYVKSHAAIIEKCVVRIEQLMRQYTDDGYRQFSIEAKDLRDVLRGVPFAEVDAAFFRKHPEMEAFCVAHGHIFLNFSIPE
jgi:hypothetical protein